MGVVLLLVLVVTGIKQSQLQVKRLRLKFDNKWPHVVSQLFNHFTSDLHMVKRKVGLP